MFWSYLKTFRVLPSYIANLQRKAKIHWMARDISDKDRLMDGHIKLPQNYFEMAIRQKNDIPSMKKGPHCSETACGKQHHLFVREGGTTGVAKW